MTWQIWLTLYVAGYLVSYYPVLRHYSKSDQFKTKDIEYVGRFNEERVVNHRRENSDYQEMTAATVGSTFFWPVFAFGLVLWVPAALLTKFSKYADGASERKVKQS